ncbi:glycosyltransferase family 32 protein [Acinetobacter sp. 'aerobic (ED)']|uniref:glycosyltransferase family 32 protein n=1 Tax=Acinetobacter sp. 'aerobic (ED)' TaxID=174230 RepID=UPI00192AB70E|nr:capsular polysaccharide synthesis protein [Acinetobacter sp. 'aerobic (ED)']
MKIFKKIFYLLKFYTMYSNQKRGVNPAIDNEADLIVINPTTPDAGIPKKIWMYWEGPLAGFVEKCVEQVKKTNPDYEVHFLTPDTVKNFCDIDFGRFPKATPQQKADLLRFELIYQYGGIWLDASTIVYESLDWIQALVKKTQTHSFAYYRAKNTTIKTFPVLENWLLASAAKNPFFKYWFDELVIAIELSPKAYLQKLKETEPNYQDLFQHIGRLEYLVAYVACQKVMRQHLPSMCLINCDKNALYFQVKHQWVKEKVLIDMAIHHPPAEMPKLIKLAGKERKTLSHYYEKGMYLEDSLLDI